MKKTFTLFFLLGSLSALMLSNSNGVFTLDYTGSANSSTQHCANAGCHANGFSGDGTIQIDVLSGTTPVWSYTPGATYTIQIKRPTTAQKVGMQSGIFLWASSTPTGTILNNLMPNNLQLNTTTNGTMISHTTFGSTAANVGGISTWRYSWTAPASNVGAIDVYAVMNITNFDNTSNGDSIVRNIFTLQQPNGINEWNTLGTQITAYPNPVGNLLSLQSEKPLTGHANVRLYSLTGSKVYESLGIADLNTFRADVSSLPASVYVCVIQVGEQYAVMHVVKK